MTARTLLLSTTLLTAGLVLGPDGARAAGYSLLEQSAESQGTSHAGSAARADDPSTLFYNPAGMVKLPGYQVSVSGTYISPTATLDSGSATTNSPFGQVPVRGTVGRDAGVDAFVPAIYGTAQIAPDWHVGLSVTSPFGLVTKYDSASIARYYGLTSSLRTMDIAPAVAWQPLPQLGIGASLIIETASGHFSNAVDFGTIGAGLGLARFGLLPGGADGTATVKGDDTSVGWQVGALYDATPSTHLGLNYRSTIYHTLTGDIQFQGVPTLLAPGFRNQNASAKIITPGNLTLGVAQDIGPVTVLAGLTWTQWSRFHSLTVAYGNTTSTTEEHWRDTATVTLGADWHVNQAVTLRAGVAYDQTPVPDQYRTPRIPDGDRYWISIGGTWNATKNLALTAAYSHIFVDSTHVGLVDSGPVSSNFLRGNLNASYSGQVNIFATSARLTF